MSDLETLIQEGLALEIDGHEAQAIAYFKNLVEQYPDNARVQFETAGRMTSPDMRLRLFPTTGGQLSLVYRKVIAQKLLCS
jgi:hypothetical protein